MSNKENPENEMEDIMEILESKIEISNPDDSPPPQIIDPDDPDDPEEDENLEIPLEPLDEHSPNSAANPLESAESDPLAATHAAGPPPLSSLSLPVTMIKARRKRTGRNCWVPGCKVNARNKMQLNLKLYGFPNLSNHQRNLWVKAINRRDEKGHLWIPHSQARICSAHFVTGERSYEEKHPDYAPSIFPPGHVYPVGMRAMNSRDVDRYLRSRQRIVNMRNQYNSSKNAKLVNYETEVNKEPLISLEKIISILRNELGSMSDWVYFTDKEKTTFYKLADGFPPKFVISLEIDLTDGHINLKQNCTKEKMKNYEKDFDMTINKFKALKPYKTNVYNFIAKLIY